MAAPCACKAPARLIETPEICRSTYRSCSTRTVERSIRRSLQAMTSTTTPASAMQALAEAGVVVDVIACNERLIALSTVRVEHDLYVLRQISGVSMSLAGALHAQGAAIVNPYPVTVALRDKVIAARILEAAGAPVPTTYVVSQPDLLAPLLNRGPLVVKPYDGTCGLGVHVVRHEADLLAE